MAQDNSITIGIGGQVTLPDLAAALQGWADLIVALGNDVAEGAQIDWVIEDLHTGSATATVVGTSPARSAVPRVVRAYGVVGDSMAKGKIIPYSEGVSRAAQSILRVLDGRVTSIAFLTADSESVVMRRPTDQGARPAIRYSLGTVTGTVETLSRHTGLKFTLYDDLFDRAVPCYPSPGQEDLLRDVWGRRVSVTGTISREPFRGMPISLRDIRQITLVPEVPPGSFREARGIVPVAKGNDRAEMVIRRLRDAQ